MRRLIYKSIIKSVMSDIRSVNTDRIGHSCIIQNGYTDNIEGVVKGGSLEEDSNGNLINLPIVKGIHLVHQTDWQRKILRRYGNVVFIDAAYKTLGYILPLFFLFVRTNCGYMIVATFVARQEEAESIAQCLEQIREWNKCLIPKHVMINLSQDQKQAVGKVFPR